MSASLADCRSRIPQTKIALYACVLKDGSTEELNPHVQSEYFNSAMTYW